MITVNLKGGLGNQLFQYSAGKALSLRKNQPLSLDTSGYIKHNAVDTPRQYELTPFNIQASIPALAEAEKLRNPFGIITKALRFFKMKVLRKFNLYFRSGKNIYLDGFFQSEKYFIDYEKVIRQDLTLNVALGPKAQEVSNNIKNTPNAISLHVRRGDYVQDANTNRYWGTCSPEYYSKALEYLVSKIGRSIHIFVFSDDIGWVKENMPFSYPATYVDPTNMKDFESIILMSRCNHHIIANSSFSWWGAWLNPKSDKIVVSPSVWAKKDQHLYKDIIPSTWKRI
jgi:hypothetical protein